MEGRNERLVDGWLDGAAGTAGTVDVWKEWRRG